MPGEGNLEGKVSSNVRKYSTVEINVLLLSYVQRDCVDVRTIITINFENFLVYNITGADPSGRAV